jgi:hypothetical protein
MVVLYPILRKMRYFEPFLEAASNKLESVSGELPRGTQT